MSNKKNVLVDALLEVDYYPVEEVEESIDKNGLVSIPLNRLASFGGIAATVKEVMNSSQSEKNTLGKPANFFVEGLYKATFSTPGGQLMKAKKSAVNFGGVLKDGKIVEQAKLTKVSLSDLGTSRSIPFSPLEASILVAVMSINQKLDELKEIQQDILSFLETDKESKLRGDLDTLYDILNKIEFNWNNEKFINQKLNLVQNIKRDARNNLIFYEKQIKENISKKNFFQLNNESDKNFKKLLNLFQYYRLSGYLYTFSSYMDVLLLGNIDNLYLSTVYRDIDKVILNYRKLYTKSYEAIEELNKKSLKAKLLKGFAKVNKAAGTTIAKIPLVEKGKLDEMLIETGEKVIQYDERNSRKLMNSFMKNRDINSLVFKENIKLLIDFNQREKTMLFDNENLYIETNELGRNQ